MAQLRSMFMPDLVGSFNQGQQIGQEQRTRRTLAEHMQGAVGGDQGALSAIYGADPESGYKVQQMAQQQQEQKLGREDKRKERLGQMARQLTLLPEGMRDAAYKQLIPELSSMGIPNLPPDYVPEVGNIAKQIADAYDPQAAAEGYTLAPGSRRFGADNKLVAESPFAPTGFKGTWDSDRGMWIPMPGTVDAGQPQASPTLGPQGGFGIAETDGYVKNIMANVGPLDPNAPPEQIVEQLLPHVIRQESAGDPNAVSPKGARGLMQVMPATGQDPGFGVRPLQNNSPEENVRFGRDYLTAMMKRYPGRPELALAAYNAGYGVADKFAGSTAQAGRSGGGGLAGIPVAGVGPKPKALPEETFSQPVTVMNPQTGRPELVQFGNRGGRRKVDDYAPGPTDRDARPPTDGQLQAAGFYERMSSAERELEATVNAGFKPGNMRDFMTAGQGPLRNWAASDEGQKYRQQQEDWVRSKLRKESGAVIGDDEMEREIKVYFPQPGDSEAVITQKGKSRKIAIDAMKKNAGRALSQEAQAPADDAGSDIDSLLDLYK